MFLIMTLKVCPEWRGMRRNPGLGSDFGTESVFHLTAGFPALGMTFIHFFGQSCFSRRVGHALAAAWNFWFSIVNHVATKVKP